MPTNPLGSALKLI